MRTCTYYYISVSAHNTSLYDCILLYTCFSAFFSSLYLGRYPSFLTHIVVGTCLHDRCCVHPPERDLSDFGRKKVFSYNYYIGIHQSSPRFRSRFISCCRYNCTSCYNTFPEPHEHPIVSVNNNNNKITTFGRKASSCGSSSASTAVRITHKCIMHLSFFICYRYSIGILLFSLAILLYL